MEKNFLLKAENVIAQAQDVTVKRLNMEICEGELTHIRCAKPEAMSSLLLGDMLVSSGKLYMAGVNIGERYINERRISLIPNSVESSDVAGIVAASVSENIDTPTALEKKRNDQKATVSYLKTKRRHCSAAEKKDIKTQINQARINKIAFELKIKRRRSELKVALKTAKGLLASVARFKQNDSVKRKLEAKVFSAEYEYALFSHKKLTEKQVNARAYALQEQLALNGNISGVLAACVHAYAKAPLLMVCVGDPGGDALETLNDFAKTTETAIVIITDKKTLLSNIACVDIDDKVFIMQ